MLLDLINQISCEKKLKQIWDNQVWVLWRSSRGRPESNSQGRPLNVRLRRPLDVISGRPRDARLGRPRDVRSGRPRDGQIGSLGESLGRWRGTSSGQIFAGWEAFDFSYIPHYSTSCEIETHKIPKTWEITEFS